eukprot:Pgem_evm1s14649
MQVACIGFVFLLAFYCLNLFETLKNYQNVPVTVEDEMPKPSKISNNKYTDKVDIAISNNNEIVAPLSVNDIVQKRPAGRKKIIKEDEGYKNTDLSTLVVK